MYSQITKMKVSAKLIKSVVFLIKIPNIIQLLLLDLNVHFLKRKCAETFWQKCTLSHPDKKNNKKF